MYCDKVTNNKMKMWKYLFVWGFVLVTLMATTAAGASTSSDKPDQIIDKFEVEEEFGVRKALAMLASLCDKNIVPSPNVDGVLAFRSLKNVTFEEAMDAILGDNFKYEQVGKLIKVYTKDEYKKIKDDPDRMEYAVITLYYITAAEAQNLMAPVLSGSSKIQVTSPAEKEISGGAVMGGSGSAVEGGGGDSLALHDTIVIYDYPENIEAARELLAILDVRPKQVLIEATILSALLNEGMELGVDWNLAAGVHLEGASATEDVSAIGGGTERGSTATSPISAISSLPGTPWETFGFAAGGGPGLRIGASTGDVRVLITALEAITDTTVLANPKILTVNKQEGSVLIGTNLGYRSSTSISTGGVATEGEVQFLQTGTQLVFRPYIGNDGYIRMEVYPKDSSATINDDGVPTETTAEMKTNIIVKNGETIVIGGLFRDTIVTTRQQVPLLGDLPIVGGLFRGTTDASQREEVIVLLTTHIIDEPSDMEGVEGAKDVRLKKSGAKNELQSIGRTKMADEAYAKAAKFYLDGDIESAMKQLKVALKLRPAYLEALRLKKRITAEMDANAKADGTVVEADQSEASTWSKK